MSVPETVNASSAPRFSLLFTPADGKAYTSKDRDLVFAQQPLENPKLPRYLFPSPTSRIKPPELKYGWRIGKDRFMSLIHAHLADAVCYCIGPELDDDGNEPDLPPEEFHRPHVNTDATLFGLDIVDSILRYLDVKTTDANRALIDVDYLCDSEGQPDIGLAVGSTYTGKILLEPHLSKLKALISPNEDPKWYLGFDNWKWSRQVPKQVSKHKTKKSTATRAPRGAKAS